MFVGKVFSKIEGDGVSDKLNGADPTYNYPIANITTELRNHKRCVM